ncbi:MAG: VapC toxin family PIN domain ribonuclease [Gammaproteobacteria bacterium]|nr:MAG: VapC toxin family PIN domain ribonuclease [Gammaproteobacteria bacterium]
MSYLLDTNICIYIINNSYKEVVDKFKTIAIGDIHISSITVSELFYGVHKSKNKDDNLIKLDNFLNPFEILVYDKKASQTYGSLRAKLEKTGNVIGSLDMLIASSAISQNFTLVTNNEKEFNRIGNLKIENWIEK